MNTALMNTGIQSCKRWPRHWTPAFAGVTLRRVLGGFAGAENEGQE